MGGDGREREKEIGRSRAWLHTSDARTSIAANRSSVHGEARISRAPTEFLPPTGCTSLRKCTSLKLQPTETKPRSHIREITLHN
ncbi:unnamed protein product [Lasius platythorax]|uniref:Uncharacterized protein n=1 Tax=Lasius platythorax TaxID=488582 RepID=A0AAV2NCF2_9HYME